MLDPLANKTPAIQAVVARLVLDLGPNLVVRSAVPSGDVETVTLTLGSDPARTVFISTAGMEDGRYIVCYDELKSKRNGDASIEQQMSSGVLYEGLLWVAQKICADGVVTGEFDALPSKRRVRQ